MNDAITLMLATPGTHYVTDPSQMQPRSAQQESPTQQCLPVYVDGAGGKVFQLHQGNRLGQELDPAIFREDAIVLRERPKRKSIEACERLT